MDILCNEIFFVNIAAIESSQSSTSFSKFKDGNQHVRFEASFRVCHLPESTGCPICPDCSSGSAAQDLTTRVTDELKWIVNREQEIAHAVGLHGENEKKLTDERDRILGNVQEVLTEVQGQSEEAKLKESIMLLEADNKSNAKLRQVSEELMESENMFEHLPKVADLSKHDRHNSSLTKPKSVDDLIHLTVFELDINERKSLWTCLVEPEFKFKVQVSPGEETVYNVTLNMEKGLAGEYRMVLGNEPLAPIMLKLHEEVTLSRIKPEKASSSVTIRLELLGSETDSKRLIREILIRKIFKISPSVVLAVAFLVMIVLKLLW